MLPSPTAEATRLTGLNLTSPQAKNTGDTRFEEVGIAAVRPAPGLHHVVTGQDISACIACDVRRQPPGLCVGSDEDEKAAAVVSAHRCARAVAYVDRRQMGVAVRGDDFRPQLDRHVRFPAELLDQIARHALLQGIASDDERHRACVIGKVQSGLTG